jgi:hypothetical protein
MAANISTVRVGGGALLNFAILCRISMASASLPLLRRNVEGEDEEAQEEDHQGHDSEYNQCVPPAHVARHSAAWLSGGDIPARLQVGTTAPLSSCTIGNGRGDDNANGLPHGQKWDQESTALGEKFKSNSRIDWNVSSKTKRSEEIDSTDGTIVVLGSSLSTC